MTKLKELRKTAGLTRVQLSERTGIPVRTLEAYEQGRRKARKISTLCDLAEALNMKPFELLSKLEERK